MKRAIEAILLLTLVAGIAMAEPVVVNFGALGSSIYNINGFPHTIDGVTFQYDPQVTPPANCTFDAGLGGTQFNLGACVGAQLDSSGLVGTTDGAYNLSFATEVFQLQFLFGVFTTANPIPQNADFGVSALFFNGLDLTDIATVTGDSLTCDGQGSCSLAFNYRGPRFTGATLNFSPFSQPDPVTGLPVGESLVAAYDMVYNVPEPGTFVLLTCALFGLGGWTLLKRRS
jgi:hypothetical protein